MNATNGTEVMKVFEFKPGRIRRGFMHFACVESFWKAGKFHAPVCVPVVDLTDSVCVMCQNPMVKG